MSMWGRAMTFSIGSRTGLLKACCSWRGSLMFSTETIVIYFRIASLNEQRPEPVMRCAVQYAPGRTPGILEMRAAAREGVQPCAGEMFGLATRRARVPQGEGGGRLTFGVIS